MENGNVYEQVYKCQLCAQQRTIDLIGENPV